MTPLTAVFDIPLNPRADATGRVGQRLGIAAVADGDDLGKDRDGHLLGGAGADVETDGTANAVELLFGRTGFCETDPPIRAGFAAADRADIARARSTACP